MLAGQIPRLNAPQRYLESAAVEIDAATRRSLELTEGYVTAGANWAVTVSREHLAVQTQMPARAPCSTTATVHSPALARACWPHVSVRACTPPPTHRRTHSHTHIPHTHSHTRTRKQACTQQLHARGAALHRFSRGMLCIIAGPLTDVEEINARLDLVQYFTARETLTDHTRAHLRECGDLSRSMQVSMFLTKFLC